MRIGRKDAQKKPPDQPQGDGGAPDTAAAKEEEERLALDQKYAAPKAFDWSKVKGPGKGKIAKQREEIKERRKEEVAAVEAKAAEREKAKSFFVLTKEQKIGAGVVFGFLAIVFYFLLRGDPGLAPALSSSQQAQMQQEAKKNAVESFQALEKQYGADHPEVKQQREMMRQMNLSP